MSSGNGNGGPPAETGEKSRLSTGPLDPEALRRAGGAALNDLRGERERGFGGDAGRLGMILFLAALGMLFAASIVGFLVVRLRSQAWLPPGAHRLPNGLWISTLIILSSSLTLQIARSAIRHGRSGQGRNWLGVTFVLGLGFLVSQALSWVHLMKADIAAGSSMYAFTFYMLTGLHGAHVLGGLIPLGITTFRANRGRYTAEAHTGVRNMAMYWHFLDVVWIVMYTVMLIAV